MTSCREDKGGCGRTIVWGIDAKGTRVPLDPSAPVYHVRGFDQATGLYEIERAGGDKPINYVSHFATCPKANHFGGTGRANRPDHRAKAAGQ